MNESTKVYYLETNSASSLRPRIMPGGMAVTELRPPDPRVNERFYREVGAQWDWIDRLCWNERQWAEYAADPQLGTWIASMDGREAGYFELARQQDGNVELAYFGLLPAFTGRGLGGPMLTRALELAWGFDGTRRVWLHTCTKDHPHAIKNYLARGMHVYRSEDGEA